MTTPILPVTIVVHVGYVIEGLLPVLEYFMEKANELSPKKPLQMRNQFAVFHINHLKEYGFKIVDDMSGIYGNWTEKAKYEDKERRKDIVRRSDKVRELSNSIPDHAEGQINGYFIFKGSIGQDIRNFIGIRIECEAGTFYTVLYDNGKNNLYKCIQLMKHAALEFVNIETPIEVPLRKYTITDVLEPPRPPQYGMRRW